MKREGENHFEGKNKNFACVCPFCFFFLNITASQSDFSFCSILGSTSLVKLILSELKFSSEQMQCNSRWVAQVEAHNHSWLVMRSWKIERRLIQRAFFSVPCGVSIPGWSTSTKRNCDKTSTSLALSLYKEFLLLHD